MTQHFTLDVQMVHSIWRPQVCRLQWRMGLSAAEHARRRWKGQHLLSVVAQQLMSAAHDLQFTVIAMMSSERACKAGMLMLINCAV